MKTKLITTIKKNLRYILAVECSVVWVSRGDAATYRILNLCYL